MNALKVDTQEIIRATYEVFIEKGFDDIRLISQCLGYQGILHSVSYDGKTCCWTTNEILKA
jgi:hypothetical protein